MTAREFAEFVLGFAMETLYRLYIDDSGNVDAATTNAPEVRYGSITGVLFQASYLDETFNAGFSELVKRHFGTKSDGTPLNLHRRVIASPPDHGPFSVLKDEAKKKAWDADSLSMFERANYTAISACVDKVAWYHSSNMAGGFLRSFGAGGPRAMFLFLTQSKRRR